MTTLTRAQEAVFAITKSHETRFVAMLQDNLFHCVVAKCNNLASWLTDALEPEVRSELIRGAKLSRQTTQKLRQTSSESDRKNRRDEMVA